MITKLAPENLDGFNKRVTDCYIELGKEQIKYTKGVLLGLYIWGDVGYTRGMLFSSNDWKLHYYPHWKRMCEEFHKLGMKVILHSDGNVKEIMSWILESGVDAYNPMEVKAGFNVLQLKKKYGPKIAWNGNIDVRILEHSSKHDVRKEVLTKLNAAKGGGYIFQSDHSISSEVSINNYEYATQLLKNMVNILSTSVNLTEKFRR